jgi:thiamine-monophosphate kinase
MSEADRIARLVSRFGLPGERVVVASGDDAAVNRPGDAVSVTSIDAVVEGVHFELPAWPLEAVGHKAVAAALSDLAAMGATAGEVYVAAGIPRSMGEAAFDSLCDGIAAAAEFSGAAIAGGDLSAAGQLWLSVTVVGYAAEETIVTRGGARPGDVVVVTGDLGSARRAIELIAGGAKHDDARLTKQFTPRPRLAAGASLAHHGATAMIDISDGLARDAGHIGRASGAKLAIELSKLPLASGIADAEFAATSGEEYELLATVPESILAEAQHGVGEHGVALTAIGRVVEVAAAEDEGAEMLDASGGSVQLRGFDHFD